MTFTLRVEECAAIRRQCFTCGEWTDKHEVQAFAYDDAGTRGGVICRACLASSAALSTRKQDYAAALRQAADLLDGVTCSSAVTLTDVLDAEDRLHEWFERQAQRDAR